MSKEHELLSQAADNIEHLRELLRAEHELCVRLKAPWECTNGDCPHLGKPMDKSCKCFRDRARQHVTAVKKELGL